MRSFVAISLCDEVKAALAALQRALPVGRPVPPDNLHLTLAFLDHQPEEALEALHEELLTLSAPPFSLSFTGIECLGRVLAVGVASCDALTALHRKVQTATQQAGIVLPRRRFRPHVTIIRLRPGQPEMGRQSLIDLNSDPLPDVMVTSFALYQSTLRPEGARHDVLARYPLT